MAECWCGLELVTKLKATVVREHDAPDLEKIQVCPEHGEDWRLSQDQVAALVEAVKAVEDLGRHNRCAEAGEQCFPEGLCLEGLLLWERMHDLTRTALAPLPKAR